jgi:hypothetical protein
MSIYIQKVEEIALSNKYTKWYLNICRNANKRCTNRKDAKQLLGYTEAHHVLPKCFKIGGEKDKENLVYLSGREHFIIHWLATKMFENTSKSKLSYAFKLMCNKSKRYNIRITSMAYSALKKMKMPRTKEHSMKIGASHKGKLSPFKDLPLSEDTKYKMKEAWKLRDKDLMSEKIRNTRKERNIPAPNKGIPHTEETLEKMRKPRSEEAKANMRGAKQRKRDLLNLGQ